MGNGESAFALQQFGWGGGKRHVSHTLAQEAKEDEEEEEESHRNIKQRVRSVFLCLPSPPLLFSPHVCMDEWSTVSRRFPNTL